MPYATADDIQTRLGTDAFLAIADRDRDGVADAPAVSQALIDASAEIDAALSERFDLPLPTPPSWAVTACVEIAVYKLSSMNPGGATDAQQKQYEARQRFLRGVADGTYGLGLTQDQMPQGDETGEVKGGEMIVEANPRLFRRGGRRF